MKQLNFNTNSKKFTVTVFFPERNKMDPQKANILYVYYITETDEDVRRLPKMSEDYREQKQQQIRKFFDFIFVVIFTWDRNSFAVYKFDFIFVIIFTWERNIFCSLQIRIFPGR